jgi:hypothetical protein
MWYSSGVSTFRMNILLPYVRHNSNQAGNKADVETLYVTSCNAYSSVIYLGQGILPKRR